MLEKYRSKVVTADKAAEAIKSGDWVDLVLAPASRN